MTLREAEAAAGFRAARPTYLPPGYRFLDNQVAVMHQGRRVILWLPFSNAVDTFSLFQRRVGAPAPPSPSGRSLTWTLTGFRFVLVGNLSPEQLRQIRDSVSF